MLGFACEYRLLAAVCTLLPDIIIYTVYDYRMVYYHSLHRKVVTLTWTHVMLPWGLESSLTLVY